MKKYTAIWLISIVFCSSGIVLEEADKLNSAGKYELELNELSKGLNEYPDDVDILWRIARAHFDIADQTADIEIHKAHLYPGIEAAKKALELNPSSARANHWYAVLIGKIGLLEGTEQKIINSYDVEKYGLRAIELDPSYDGTYHVMGRWHFELASLSWIERTIAEWVYETPPEGGFDHAADFYRKAIQAKPDEIRHHLWLGKTLIELDDEAEAEKVFNHIMKMKPMDDSDRNMQKEAKELLEDL